MWEDFVRGNWPAAAPMRPDPLPSANPVTATSVHTGGAAQSGSIAYTAGYARTSSWTKTVSHVQAQPVSRPASRKLAVKAALAAGAGLILAVVVPGSALASGGHAVGTHAAAHAATGG